MARCLALVALCLAGVLAQAPQAPPTPPLDMVLTTIHQTPDLSIFSSLITSTGGDNVSSPDLGERFNNPDSCIKYTVFAPTNDAFANISAATMRTLAQPYSYDLLLALIRTHIVQTQISPTDLLAGGPKPFTAIEGFPISVGAPGNISLSQGLVESAVPVNQTARIILDVNGVPESLPCSNGVVYKINGLLNPFASYYGIDGAAAQLPQVQMQFGSNTMTDIVTTHPSLTNLSTILTAGNPEFLDRLSLFPNPFTPNPQTVFLAPSDTAFAFFPPGALARAGTSGNVRLTGYLLEFGLGRFDQQSGMVESISGFNLSVVGGVVGNAGVEERVCSGNGFVWVVGRWLDPLAG